MRQVNCRNARSVFKALTCVAVSVIGAEANATVYELTSVDKGWYNSTRENTSYSSSSIGWIGADEYRSYFVFAIPSECATGVKSADLVVYSNTPSLGHGVISNAIDINGLSIFHSSTIGANTPDLDIFNDMGDGKIAQVSNAGIEDFIVNEPLSENALVSIEASAGAHGKYAVAMAYSHSVSPQHIMEYGGDDSVEGKLTIDCEPVASITVTQSLVNDNNGSAQSNDFVPMIDGLTVEWNVTNRIFSGNYAVSENMLTPGYSMGVWGGDCSADGSIELHSGQSAVCTVTNNDMPATLMLTHTVINDGGGSAKSTDFEAYLNGVLSAWDINQTLDAGSHKLAITALNSYRSSQWKGDCTTDGSIVLALGQVAKCEIVSNDMSIDLVVDKSVSDTSPKVGDIVTFSLQVSNLGPDIATNVKVVDVVMNGLEYQQGSILGPGSLSDDDPYTNGLLWVINNLSVGAPVNLTFDAKILQQ